MGQCESVKSVGKFSARLIIVTLISSFWVAVLAAPATLEVKYHNIVSPIFFAEVVATRKARAIGLMHRATLPRCWGMWFDFEQPKVVSMWMKNTLLPLDIIFLDEDFRVNAVYEKAQPLSDVLITSPPKTKYVLEINAGEALRNRVVKGGRFVVQPLVKPRHLKEEQCM